MDMAHVKYFFLAHKVSNFGILCFSTIFLKTENCSLVLFLEKRSLNLNTANKFHVFMKWGSV